MELHFTTAVILLVFSSSLYSKELPENESDWADEVMKIIDASHIPDGGNADEISRMGSLRPDLTVEFMLYTRQNKEKPFIIHIDNVTSIEQSYFNPSKDLKLIIHGWKNGHYSPVGEMLKEEYLDAYDVNVIVVDWSSQSFRNYVGSRMAVPKVADVVAEMLDILVTNYGMDLSKIHLVGHSLGAHVAGITGLRMTSGQPSRVTGLDPAAPMFTMAEEDILKPLSAKFVDVIHTCGYMLGFISPLGHADFYPNKGTPAQPGCGFDMKGECSHSRAYELFAESIRSDKFLSVECKDGTAFDDSRCSSEAVPMGEFTPSSARGTFYLKTNSKGSFATGKVY